MASTDDSMESLSLSLAAATEAPKAYFAAPAADTLSSFLNNPLGSWHSIALFAVLITALASCTAFLGLRYAEILRPSLFDYTTAPLTLEAQKPKSSKSTYTRNLDDFPTTPTSYSGDADQAELRRRPRTSSPCQPNVIVKEVKEGKIALRRASRSRSQSSNRKIEMWQGTTATTEQA